MGEEEKSESSALPPPRISTSRGGRSPHNAVRVVTPRTRLNSTISCFASKKDLKLEIWEPQPDATPHAKPKYADPKQCEAKLE